VAVLRFSRRAEDDLLSIGGYTLRAWGRAQAIRYLDDLEACCRMLAANPAIGRGCDDIRPGLRRMERGRHVVFHRENAGGILVSRILHQRMLADRQEIANEEEEG
jgi:toxin ParE1/3/4